MRHYTRPKFAFVASPSDFLHLSVPSIRFAPEIRFKAGRLSNGFIGNAHSRFSLRLASSISACSIPMYRRVIDCEEWPKIFISLSMPMPCWCWKKP